MKKAIRWSGAVVWALFLALAAPAFAQAVTGIVIYPATRFEFTNCSSGGSAAQTLTAGTYLFRVTTEDVWICYAATCAADGEKLPAGFSALWSFRASQSVSCRSASSTGDAIFTKAGL